MDGISVIVLAAVVIAVGLAAVVGTSLRRQLWAWVLLGLMVVSIIGVVVQ